MLRVRGRVRGRSSGRRRLFSHSIVELTTRAENVSRLSHDSPQTATHTVLIIVRVLSLINQSQKRFQRKCQKDDDVYVIY